VGAAVGDAVGYTVGALVGAAVGALVGDAVGYAVGAVVGDAVGYAVGYAVGLTVGVAVGNAVGNGVGIRGQIVTPSTPSVHRPTGQLRHLWYLNWYWNLPDGQWKQLVLPVHFAYVPLVQFLQAAPEDSWYCPILHSSHPEESSMAYVPLAQAVQLSSL
jgi:hypothetical protein